MRTILLDSQAITALLSSEKIGRLGTIDEQGFPCVIPVQFVFDAGRIYIHSGVRGEKLDNIRRNPQVGFEIDAPEDLITTDKPCNTSIRYTSVVVKGVATLIDDTPSKMTVLRSVIAKYTPQHVGKELPEAALRRVTVIAIEPRISTGKHHTDA